VDPNLPETITSTEAWKTLRNLKNLDRHSDEVKRLKKTKLAFDHGDEPVRTNAAEVLTLLSALDGEDDSPLRRNLSDAKMRFDIDGTVAEFTADDLRKVHEQLRESRIPARLLAIEGPVVPEKEGINPRYTYMLLFILVMIVLWFGCNNAAKEI